jgi:hypothetical protein
VLPDRIFVLKWQQTVIQATHSSGLKTRMLQEMRLMNVLFELEVLKDPVQVRDCGHQFCALCIDDILK